MTKQEFDVLKLHASCEALRKVCTDLRRFPQLQKKAMELRDEICREYEKKYDELHGHYMWVARDKGGTLHAWDQRPCRYKEFYHSPDDSSSNIWEVDDESVFCIELDKNLYPELKWEDEPIKVLESELIQS